jgi:Lipid A 3-O-deacylase (PagL)
VLNLKKRYRTIKTKLFQCAAATVLLSVSSLIGNAQSDRYSFPSLPSPGESKDAQIESGDERLPNELGVWGGGSLFVRSTRSDRSDDGRMYIVGLSFARAIAVRRSFALSYTADLTPLLLLSHPRVQGEQSEAAPGEATLKRSTVRGTGLAPIGFKINFRPGARTQPFLDLKLGFAVFNQKIPTERGTNFNFTAQSGGGIQFLTGPRTSITFGSRFLHISNGGRGLTNPGFNNVMLFTAFSIRK